MDNISKKRNSSIELLRLLLMLMIVGGHVCNTIKLTYGDNRLWPLMCLLHVAVPTFILISGYFGIKLTIKRVVNFYLYCVLWNIICTVIHTIFVSHSITIRLFATSFLPFSFTYGRWFLTYYFLLMLFSPAINAFSESLDNKWLLTSVIIMITMVFYCGIIFHDKELGNLINDGKSIIYFITVYLLGRYLYRIQSLFFYFGGKRFHVIFCIYVFFVFFTWQFSPSSYSYILSALFYHYPSFVIIGASALLFVAFLNNRMNNDTVNKISSSAFAIYLFHEHHLSQFIYQKMSHLIYNNTNNMVCVLLMILLIISIASIAIIIDKIIRIPLQKTAINIIELEANTAKKMIQRITK